MDGDLLIHVPLLFKGIKLLISNDNCPALINAIEILKILRKLEEPAGNTFATPLLFRAVARKKLY